MVGKVIKIQHNCNAMYIYHAVYTLQLHLGIAKMDFSGQLVTPVMASRVFTQLYVYHKGSEFWHDFQSHIIHSLWT